MGKELIPLKDYAKLHGVQTAYLRRLIQTGRLSTVIKKSGRYYIDKNEPYPADRRVRSGSYIGWRQRLKKNKEG